MNIWTWIVAAVVMAVIGVAVSHAFPAGPMVVPPSAGGINQPTAFAQAINVVQIHPNREIVQQSVRTIEETKRLVENSNAR